MIKVLGIRITIPQLEIQLSNCEVKTLEELKKEVEYCIEWLTFEIEDQNDDEINYIKSCKSQIVKCKELIKKLDNK